MKHRKQFILLGAEAICCAASAAVYSGDDRWLMSFLSFPFEPLGRLLRSLSLSGGGGDSLAWCLCIAVSVMPLWLLRIRGKWMWMDALLPLASLLTFAALYFSVNPSLLPRWLGEAGALMGIPLIGGAVYSSLLTWLILRLVDRMESARIWPLGRALLWTLAAVFVFAAFGSGLSSLFEEIAAVRAGNTAPGQPVLFTTVILALGYLVEAFSWLLDLWVLLGAQTLLYEVQADKTGEAAVSAAEELYRRARLSLVIGLVSAFCYDLLQLLLSRWLLQLHTTLRLPIFSIAFLLLMLVLSRLLRENKGLRDDNDLFI